MKCIEIGSPATLDTLRCVEREPARPGATQVLVRVRASSLNFHDYLVASGVLPTVAGRVPLSDGVAEVVEVGPQASMFRVGERVLGTFFPDWHDGLPTATATARMRGDHVDGFASEYVTLPESHFTAAPAGLSDIEAATLPCAALTAWRALVVEGQVKPGDVVLVEGSGGVSIFALQFAKLAGAIVIATTSSEEKASRLKALGADHVIDRVEFPKWGRSARELTGGDGVDHLIEVVGGDLSQSLQACRVGARLCLVGALSRQPIQFQALLALQKNLRISGITVGSRRHQQDMVRAIEAARLQPAIDRVVALSELREAFEYQVKGSHVGKICVTL
ncbi:MAG: NAD(P)-dependent alcohol dehydrogenase [Pseudomonadota bacterium]|nr:NAD(P)-dependent alcohol dehydrogenase [Pseudomonadota bacterium]